MSKYYLHVVALNECSYSMDTVKLLDELKIKYTVQYVEEHNKEKFKLENYFTFPQIFLRKSNSVESLFFGGYSDLINLINTFKDKKYNQTDIDKFKKKYKQLSNIAVLKLILSITQ
jgi:glutaredoxin